VVGIGLLIDLAGKHVAWRFLGPPPESGGRGAPLDLVPGWLQLVTSENPGIVFGFDFAHALGFGPGWGRAVTIALTAATCGFIFYLFAVSRPSQRWLHVLSGLVLAGALGNLYDRLAFGYVRDFLQISGHVTLFGRTLAWPYVFNIADLYLVMGVLGVAAACLFTRSPGAKPQAEGNNRPCGKPPPAEAHRAPKRA
jgi:signal peptidase II